MALQLRRGTNAERLAITPQQGELIFVTDYLAVNITATSISSSTITFSAAHNLAVGQKILYQGATSYGLILNTVYYVLTTGLTTTSCKLSLTSGGTAVVLTDATAQALTFNKAPTLANGTPVGNVSPLWIGNGTTVGGVAAQVSVLNDLLDVTLGTLAEGQTLYYDATSSQWKNTGILTIDDSSGQTNIFVNGSNPSLYTTTNTNINIAYPSLELYSKTIAAPAIGHGSSLNFSANNSADVKKYLGYTSFNYTDLTPNNEDASFAVRLLKGGMTPIEPESTTDNQLTLTSTGDLIIDGNMTIKASSTNDSWVDFEHPTKTGHLAWAGSGLFINGDFDVAGTGTNGTASITAGLGTTMGIANIFNNANIGTVNLANGATKLNLGGLTTGTTTLVKSPQLNLVGDILVGGNEIKTGTFNNQTDVWTNEKTAILLEGIDVDVKGVLKVTGNKIKSSNADAIELSSSNVTVVGDLNIRGAGVQSDITAEKPIGTLFTATPTVYVGTGSANTVVSIGGTESTTTINHNAVVAGDLAVNGSNSDNAWATISTTNTQAELFVQNATSINIGYQATDLNMGATSGITTIRNNAVITGDATVNGGNININGTATKGTQPFLTFQTQDDTNLQMYGVRGKSSTDDAWFVGSGGAGDDLGYLEIATGDNIGGSNTGGQIYVRQYNNGSTAPLGVPWEGGTGVAVNTLTLLDANGNTEIPKNLNLVIGSITTQATNARIFSDGAMPDTIDMGASATAISFGSSIGTGTTTVRNSLVVSGNLTVNGTTTTVNSTTLTVDDKNIELGHSPNGASPTDTTAQGGGITLKGATDKTIIWNNATDGWELNQSIKVTGNTVTTGDLTVAGGNVSLTNGTSNIIDFNGSGLQSPTTTTRSAGTKLVLYPSLSSTEVDYAIGATSNVIWNSVKSNSDTQSFKWFGGTTEVAKLDGVGNLQFAGNLTLGSNTIKSSNGTTAITTTATGDIIVGDDIFARSNYLQLNYGTTGSPTTGTAGIEIERGDLTNSSLYWDEPTDSWFTSHQLKVLGNLTVNGDGYIFSSTNLALTLSGADVTVAGSLATNGNTTLGSDASDTVTVNGLVNGNITFGFNNTTTPKGILGKTATGADDFWFIGGATTGTDAGYAMIATGDNGTEPIYVRQYNGSPISGTVARQLTLLDASGNTGLAGNLTVAGDGYIYSSTGLALHLTGSTVKTAGDLIVGSGVIKSANATTALTLADTTGNVTVAGDLTVGGSDIKDGNGNTALSLYDVNVKVNGELTINGNKIRSSGGTAFPSGDIAVQLSGSNVEVVGDLTVTGNDIKSSTATALTLSGTNVTVAGDLTVGGNDIKSANGTTALSLADTTGNVTVAGDLFVAGNTILSNGGYSNLQFTNSDVQVVGNLQVSGDNIKSATGASALTLSGADVTINGDLTLAGNDIKASNGATNITLTSNSLTTFAGDIKLGGDSVYSSTGWRMFDYREQSSIYGTSYQVKMNADKNVGLSTSFVVLDNMVEMNTSSLTTTATTIAVLDYFDKTQYRSAKYIVQISNGTAHQMWEGMVIHDGTNIFVSAYGDLRTTANNLATMSVGFNATTGHPELRVTPVNATQTKFKATKTYIAV